MTSLELNSVFSLSNDKLDYEGLAMEADQCFCLLLHFYTSSTNLAILGGLLKISLGRILDNFWRNQINLSLLRANSSDSSFIDPFIISFFSNCELFCVNFEGLECVSGELFWCRILHSEWKFSFQYPCSVYSRHYSTFTSFNCLLNTRHRCTSVRLLFVFVSTAFSFHSDAVIWDKCLNQQLIYLNGFSW